MRPSEVISLGLSLGAASLSAYVLVMTLQSGGGGGPGVLPGSDRCGDRRDESVATIRKEEKKRKQAARCKEIETLIMERGAAGTQDYRVHVLAKSDECTTVAELSLWHDVPLAAPDCHGATQLFNFICEIPKCTRKKFEVATCEGTTPIKQDTKKGVLREFKKGDIFFNYGCFPRTWEDPRHVSDATGQEQGASWTMSLQL